MLEICKKDIDEEIDTGSEGFIEVDNGKCYNCKVMGKCIDLHNKILFMAHCENCNENDDRICKTCISYLAHIIQNNKFNRLVRSNFGVLYD